MKRTIAFALCFAAIASMAGAIILEERPHPLLLNGKAFGNAVMINGNLVMSLDDFFKAATGSPNPGTSFVVRGNQLLANPAAQGAIILQNSAFHVRKAGEVSSHLMTLNGKTFIPVVDVMHAFGSRSWVAPANLQPGQSISLNFTVNGDGVLAVGH